MTSFDSREISRIHHELHAHLPSEPALRTKALESLLTEKKLIDAEAVDAWIDMYRDEIGPKRGARVVAPTPRSGKGCWPMQPRLSPSLASQDTGRAISKLWRTLLPCTT